MTKGHIYSLVFFICFAPAIQAQDMPVQSWIEEQRHEGGLEVAVNYLSDDGEIVLIDYEIEVLADDQSLSEYEAKGQFLSVPRLPILLKSLIIRQTEKSLSLRLRLLKDDHQIWQEEWSLQGGGPLAQQDPKAAPDVASEAALVPPSAKPKDRLNSPYHEDAEIGGLIIDESRTKLGRDFYEQFFSKWIPPQGIGDSYMIKIKELPSFGRVSRISVQVNDQPLMTRSLSPNFGQLEANVNASIRGVRSYLVQSQQLSKDLENEDQLGSGIF